MLQNLLKPIIEIMYNIYTYLYHFTDCPHHFMKDSKFSNEKNGIDTNALLMDVVRQIDSTQSNTSEFVDIKTWKSLSADHLKAIQLGAWFFSLYGFDTSGISIASIQSFLIDDLKELSRFVTPKEWLSDEDRSEEFVRMALSACQIYPDGESTEDAMDRLEALSTLKRNNVLNESSEAYNRIIAIRRQMAEQKAREAANVYGRE